MAYNLLFDTQFDNITETWKFRNCSYEDGYLISNDKVFGIEQEIVLPEITKLYFRALFNILDSKVFKIYIGIQNDNKLFVNNKHPVQNKEQLISMVEETKEEKIKVHIIFESEEKINKVIIKEPLLCDLRRLHKLFFLKGILDKTIKYRFGYSYKNLLSYYELTPKIFNLDSAKIGSYVSTQEKIILKLDYNFEKNKKYLVKLDYKELNDLGKTYINYGVLKSTQCNNNQCYLLFKGNDIDLNIIIEPNDVLPYKVNLRHILLLDLSKLNIKANEIAYLPYIKGEPNEIS